MVLTSLFAALITVCAWMAVPIPPVGFTLQTLGVLLALGILGGKRGTWAIGLYLLLLLRLLYMAHKTPDRFGKLVIVVVCSMFFFHIFENIGMTIGVMPITGIPLPFMSYGGSNMWTNMICIGLAQNVYCRRNRVRYTGKSAMLL